MAGRKRPTQKDARERLQAAQDRESAALAAVELAANKVRRAESRRATVIADLKRRVQEAEDELIAARVELVDVSGVQRSAVLLGDTAARVRADVRAAAAKQS